MSRLLRAAYPADGTAPAYPAQGNCGTGSSVSFTDGVATVDVTIFNPETTVLEVTDNSSGMFGTSASITVAGTATTSTATPGTTTPGPTTTTTLASNTPPEGTTTTTASVSASSPGSFSVSPATSEPTAGNVFEVTITALDAADALDPAYSGPQCLTFSGPDDATNGTAPTYPAPGDCTSGGSVSFAAGVATVNVTLVDPGATMLEVTDSSSGLFGASVPLIVSAPGGGNDHHYDRVDDDVDHHHLGPADHDDVGALGPSRPVPPRRR